jgi:hypothetical protein
LLCASFLPAGDGEEPKKDKEKPSSMPAKAPPEALLFIDQLADVLKAMPRAVILSPEKHKELLAELDRLQRKLAEADKKIQPSGYDLKGKVEAGRVNLTATFTLLPRQAGAVWLACGKKVHAIRGMLDGKPAPLRSDRDSGLYVLLDGSAEKAPQLVLELTVPLQTKGNTRFFEVDLPEAAWSLLDLELPPGLKDVRVGDLPLTETTIPKLVQDRISGSIGRAERLVVSWREPQAVTGPMLLTTEGTIEAIVDEKAQLTTTATLNLHVKGGQTSSWRVLVPPGAELKVAPEFENRVTSIDTEEKGFASLRTIHLKEPTSDSLTVTVRVPPKGPLPKGGARVPVGPFAAQGAIRQTGTLTLKSHAREVQLQLVPAAETTPRPLTVEEQKLAPFVRGFKYERVPLPEKASKATGPGSYSLLDIEAESVRGVIETRTSHIVRLAKANEEKPGEPRPWEVTTTIKARLVQPGVEWLEVQLPPGAEYVSAQGNPPKWDRERNVLQFHLEREGWKELSITFRARYQEVAAPPFDGEKVLILPRPLETERAPEFLVEVRVTDDLELIVPEKPNPALELVRQAPQEQKWQADPAADRLQEQITIAWRRYRPEIRTDSTVDLTLTPREGRIKQEIRLRQGRLPQQVLSLRVPPELKDVKVSVLQGGAEVGAEKGKFAVRLSATADQDPVVVLGYSIPVTAGRNFAVPLLVPEQATVGETRVRIYSEPGLMPLCDGAGWEELPVEEVTTQPPGQRRLPVLVLLARRIDPALALRFAEGQGKLPPVVARRALIRVEVKEGQGPLYRASYVLQQTTGRTLDVELPRAWQANLLEDLRFTLDGNQIDPESVEGAERTARLRLPAEALTRPVLLDVQYRLPPTGTSPITTTLQPPVLVGDPGRLLVRWAIVLPAGWVALAPEEGPGTRRTWGRRGVLFVSRPMESLADLEGWLTGTDPGTQEPNSPFVNPTLVCWRTGVQPLTVIHLSQQVWLLACSLVVLAVGLVFVFWWRRVVRQEGSPAALLVALMVVILGIVLLSLWYSTLLAAVTLGAEPGAAVLLLVVVLQWLAHERERRRLLFLPSFTRKPVSTVTRTPTPVQPRTEPSTVDAAPASGGGSQSS